MDNQVVLQVEHLGKSFGTHEVLKDIHFKVSKGEVISVIGIFRLRKIHPFAVHQYAGRTQLWQYLL